MVTHSFTLHTCNIFNLLLLHHLPFALLPNYCYKNHSLHFICQHKFFYFVLQFTYKFLVFIEEKPENEPQSKCSMLIWCFHHRLYFISFLSLRANIFCHWIYAREFTWSEAFDGAVDFAVRHIVDVAIFQWGKCKCVRYMSLNLLTLCNQPRDY